MDDYSDYKGLGGFLGTLYDAYVEGWNALWSEENPYIGALGRAWLAGWEASEACESEGWY